jgi:hypothetical protein
VCAFVTFFAFSISTWWPKDLFISTWLILSSSHHIRSWLGMGPRLSLKHTLGGPLRASLHKFHTHSQSRLLECFPSLKSEITKFYVQKNPLISSGLNNFQFYQESASLVFSNYKKKIMKITCFSGADISAASVLALWKECSSRRRPPPLFLRAGIIILLLSKWISWLNVWAGSWKIYIPSGQKSGEAWRVLFYLEKQSPARLLVLMTP